MFVGFESDLKSFNVEFQFKDMSIRLTGKTHAITASLDGQLSLRLHSPKDSRERLQQEHNTARVQVVQKIYQSNSSCRIVDQ